MPSGNEKSVFGTSSGMIHICLYVLDMSMINMKGWDATASHIISWFGNGVKLITVLALHS
jgi:hypothetical protein